MEIETGNTSSELVDGTDRCIHYVLNEGACS